jgi:pSer/pThr/pTyr-binding forkhead associated (FHA) protein
MTRISNDNQQSCTSGVISLEKELCEEPNVWLLVEVKPYARPVYISVLRVMHVLVIGRDPAVGLVLDGALVSRRHALIRATGGGLEIEDISRHGTLVDGQPLHSGRSYLAGEGKLLIGCNRVRLRRLG